MRYVAISKEEFDDYLYPAFAGGASENEEQLEISARTKRKLRKIASDEVISKERYAEAERVGAKIVPYLKLNYDAHLLELEEDEYRLMLDRFRKHISRVTSAVAEEVYDLFIRLKDAPSERPEPTPTVQLEA